MRRSFATLSLILLLASLLVVPACKLGEVKSPEVSVTKAKFNAVSLQHGRLDAQLRVSNPNVFKLPIKAVSYKLFLNDREFSDGATQHKMKIPAGGSQLVELPLDIRYEQLLSSLGSVFTYKAIRFHLKGEIDFGLVKVPYRKTGEFTLK